MAKVKFVIVSGGMQPGLKLGRNEKPPELRNFDIGVLQIEDKCIQGVINGIKRQAGSDERVQAWKKEHGVDGWMLCDEQAGSSKRSWGEVNADLAPDTKKDPEEAAEEAQQGE